MKLKINDNEILILIKIKNNKLWKWKYLKRINLIRLSRLLKCVFNIFN